MTIPQGALRRSLLEWDDWWKKISATLIPRKPNIKIPEGFAVVLTGVRRCGKTFSAAELSEKELETSFYFNFEDPIFLESAEAQHIDALLTLFEEEHGHAPTLVVLDEIHNIIGWERWARKAIDLQHFKLVLTGSSSHLLSSEIATAISGRAIEHNIWPLSFQEFLKFQNKKLHSEAGFLRELKSYLKWGGFPRVVLAPDHSEKILLLKQYLSDIVLRDVVARHSIQNTRSLEQLVSWYLTNPSSLHSYTAIRKAFGSSIELISAQTSYLNQAFLVFEIPRYHPNLKIQARDPKKTYIIDNGLRTVSLASDREEWGRLAENTVFIELKRRGKTISYFKENQEVDFVTTELGQPKEAIQVSFSDLQQEDTYQREVSALLECLTALKLKSGIILTLNLEDQKTFGHFKIHFIPLYQWLLSE